MMKKTIVTLAVALGFGLSATAQHASNTTAMSNDAQSAYSAWHIGVGGGVHGSFLRYSDLNEETFPEKKGDWSGVFTVFGERTFGKKAQFVVRPELNILRRGGTLTDIFSNVEFSSGKSYYDEFDISDVRYRVRATYLDLRVPLAYQFGDQSSRLRPYVFVSPILGFTLGGSIDAEYRHEINGDESYKYDGVHMDASKANYAGVYFALAAGAGVKYQFRVGRHDCFLAAEAQYEHGLSDTYGDDNAAKNKIAIGSFPGASVGDKIEGTRKYSGVEFRVLLGIPLSLFSKAPAAPVVHVVEPKPVVVEEPKEEKPCYSLEEINDLMARGENVKGKTICAINDAINFDFGKSQVKPESYAYLDRLATTLIRTNSRIMVKGHTDNVGTEEFNLNLSKERAMAVVDYLVGKGVPRARLAYDYYGMSLPLTTNDTEEGRTLNRRVEFEILK